MKHLLTTLFALTLLGACSAIPKVSKPYFFPMGQSDIMVTQTVGCKVSGKDLMVPGDSPLLRSTATSTVTHSYVPYYDSKNTHAIEVSDIDGIFSDADIAITLTDDGRLSAVNGTSTGQSSAIVKGIATVASVYTGTKALLTSDSQKQNAQAICKAIIHYGTAVDKDKMPGSYTLTINYKQRLTYPTGNAVHTVDGQEYAIGAEVPIPIDPATRPFGNKEFDLFPPFYFQVLSSTSKSIQPARTDDHEGGTYIEVPTMTLLNLAMIGPIDDLSTSGKFWYDTLLVPTDNATAVPLPKGRLFGKIVTTVQFANSGVVNKIEYNKTNGLADLFSGASQVLNQTNPASETNAQKGAAVQAQADLIYEQQRLIQCQLDASKCPSK